MAASAHRHVGEPGDEGGLAQEGVQGAQRLAMPLGHRRVQVRTKAQQELRRSGSQRVVFDRNSRDLIKRLTPYDVSAKPLQILVVSIDAGDSRFQLFNLVLQALKQSNGLVQQPTASCARLIHLAQVALKARG